MLRNKNDFASIVNDAQYARLRAWLDEARAAGAQVVGLSDVSPADAAERFIAPTVVLDALGSVTLMREENFGPVLPVEGYRDFDEAVAYVRARVAVAVPVR
ncbi:MAG TPA: aldehyde dehydrogenase family protein [Rhodanobacteraceae bacterium]|nr:aldehyde dehydrogenase family protein [Rhodanobacteraceae bacterium]